MKEWHRTIILVVLLLVLAWFFYWLRTGYEAHILKNF